MTADIYARLVEAWRNLHTAHAVGTLGRAVGIDPRAAIRAARITFVLALLRFVLSVLAYIIVATLAVVIMWAIIVGVVAARDAMFVPPTLPSTQLPTI